MEADDPVAARSLVVSALDHEELALYFGKEKELREARTLEFLGDTAAAAEQWRALAKKDPLHAALGLRMTSNHPDRDALFAEVVADVRARVDRAVKGDKAVEIFVTSKGEPRYLEVIPDDQVLSRLAAYNAGDEAAKPKYCYIANVDLTGVDPAKIPQRLDFERCVLGNVRIPDRDIGTLVIKGFVLGNFDVGKTWEGAVNKSRALAGSRFVDVTTRETVFLGRANFQDVSISGRKAAFPLTVFEGGADFRGARVAAAADFRFSVFGDDANFKRARFGKALYFGSTRFRKQTRFTELSSEEQVYFDSARFEAPVAFDACEFGHGATFENAYFAADAGFDNSRVEGRVNLSRSVFAGALTMREVVLGGLDAFGADLSGDVTFVDARVDGKVRFSLDDATRTLNLKDPTPLLALYRDYQGDEDAEEPIAAGTSYGVQSVDDLTATILGNLRFDNAVLTGFVIFERVRFGWRVEGNPHPMPPTTAEFYNTQFLGETHFERTEWNSLADFTTIRAQELAFNEATFNRSLILDDADIPGRVTLTDANFGPSGAISFYGAQIANFQVSRDQIENGPTGHRLWYEQCADGSAVLQGDPRYERQVLAHPTDEAGFRLACHDRMLDEFGTLKQSFDSRAMTADTDWAYWWTRHLETFAGIAAGEPLAYLAFPVRYFLFEWAFGWGVRLGNLAGTALAVCVAFAWIYKHYCGDTLMEFDGERQAIRNIPWISVFYISLQTLGGFNTGWDFGASNTRFRYLNTAHTYLGLIIVTFFVGAYTRMILS